MAKKRKGAKKTSASRSKPSKAKSPKRRPPVSPTPRKTAPKGGTTHKSRSRAAVRGWETRRRENPLRWGSKAIAERRGKLGEVRKAKKTLEFTSADIEREWRSIERKALKQRDEAEAAGGEHPLITAKLAPLRRIRAEMDQMETMITTFNNPLPDRWELEAYHTLENFITLKDGGALKEDSWVVAAGPEVLSKYGTFDTPGAAQETIERLGIENGRPMLVTGVKASYQKWYEAKTEARLHSKDWPAWMAMIGSVLGLPMHGDFSVDSFVTS
jgi:hypothetical protein